MHSIPLPQRLQEIPDPPVKLFCQGSFQPKTDSIFLTVVGSRAISPYGKNACERILSKLAGFPFVIISGLALGTDAYAHTTALDIGLPCIAVPGSGLHDSVLYPRSNRGLAQRIISSGGCLLSEFDETFKAQSWSFPKRNRIMAGLSHAVLVIEAQNRSGTRITARLATEYNRDVFVVPGSIFSSHSEGCHRLIQEGAYLIHDGEDILRHFNLDTQQQKHYQHTSARQQDIIALLQKEPLGRNALAEQLHLPIHELQYELSLLEINGISYEHMGKIYLR